MFMQAGFALVETGLCRAKNANHTMMMNFMVYGFGMFAYWVMGFALQQGGSAGLHGSIYDGQGAIVPSAKVTLTHLSTNQARNAVSNEVGQFQFPLIPVGRYRITVEHPGFKKFEQTGIQVQVNDNVKADVTLELGEISSVVKVDAAGIATWDHDLVRDVRLLVPVDVQALVVTADS